MDKNFIRVLFAAVIAAAVNASTEKSGGQTRGLRETDPCTETERLYQRKGFTHSVPSVAVKGTNLRICDIGYTCCTEEMESQLATQSVLDFENKVAEKSNFVKDIFSARFKKFDVFFQGLIEKAKESLDDLFEQTYGTLYSDNSRIFMNLFDELKQYYRAEAVDMDDIFDSFFTTLMQQVFKLLNPSFDIDDDYMQCIADNINTIQPFSDLPQKLSNQVRRAFIAARTFVQGLESGQLVAQNVAKIYPTTSCAKALMGMSYCSKCNGYLVIKPCHDMCLNVMRGCLCNLGDDINDVWNRYIDSMMMLLNRLEGPFNIESVLDPIDVKISEAIMTLQDNKIDIRNTVFELCGRPRAATMNTNFATLNGLNFGNFSFFNSYQPSNTKPLESLGKIPGLRNIDLSKISSYTNDDASLEISKRSVDDDLEDETVRKTKKRRKKNRKRRRRGRKRRRDQKVHVVRRKKNKKHTSTSGDRYRYRNPIVKPNRKTRLVSSVHEMRSIANQVKNFWKNLPMQVCQDEAEQGELQCWNGKAKGKYSSLVMKDGLKNQLHNPEVAVNVSQVPDIYIRRQATALQEVTSKLRHAYHGIDPAQVDADGTSYDFPMDEPNEEYSGQYSGEGSADDSQEAKKGINELRGNMPFDMKNTEGLYVEDLETWQVKLVEQVLGEHIAPRTSLAEIQERLAQHPNFGEDEPEHGVDTWEGEVFADLKKSERRRIEKMLGKSIDPKTSLEKVDSMLQDYQMAKTAVTEGAISTTTGGAENARCSVPVIVTILICLGMAENFSVL